MAAMDVTEDPVAARARRYDPYRLTSPQVFLLSQLVFLILVGFLAAILFRQIRTAFDSNPGLNGLILGVLAIGILLAFRQVVSLFREVRWVNSFRAGGQENPKRPPVLLAPMRAMLGRTQATQISTLSMRAILDSIATRLDESRDTSRYLIGLLVFLGLLGTFWGLLQTIGSIGATIQALDISSGNTADVLDALKRGLGEPLDGMGTAFSTSLFGLAGSLILGFLDLQAGRAQNRFYTELENWLASVADPGFAVAVDADKDGAGEHLKVVAEKLQTLQETGGSSQRTTAALASLAEGIQGLVRNMRSEQQMMRDWVEAQAAQQAEMKQTLDRLAGAIERERKG